MPLPSDPELVMRCCIALIAIVSLAGCTTLRPIEGTPAELQQRLNSGDLLKSGDRVSIVTADYKTHVFKVTAAGTGIIEGRRQSVPVDQVVSVQKRQFSPVKTWILVGACVLAIGSIAYAASHAAPSFTLQ
jgi:hypothetical protein